MTDVVGIGRQRRISLRQYTKACISRMLNVVFFLLLEMLLFLQHSGAVFSTVTPQQEGCGFNLQAWGLSVFSLCCTGSLKIIYLNVELSMYNFNLYPIPTAFISNLSNTYPKLKYSNTE